LKLKNAQKYKIYRNYIKRFLGFVLALLGLIIIWPLMFIIAIAISLDSKGGVLFKQKRLGKNLKEFTVYKFRTMIKDAYQIGGATSYDGDPRITRLGAFLRKTSLDELPQLVNILFGDMCFIGPRPILEEEFEPYKNNIEYRKRYLVTPGLFCTVDVEYRATAPRKLQMEMDAEYVEKMSLILDIKTLLGVFISVTRQKNIYKARGEERNK
jgi:lipopolysaccharide/colanic/teichoic acid biosynthesis glycosyltransferase